MYAFFKGTVDYLTGATVELDVGGVGYLIQISSDTASRLSGHRGETVTIYTYTQVREDELSLFGFLSRDDLNLFRQLITVSGVGPKAGLSLLSALSADDLRFALASGDVKAISRAPGIGRKTAERLVLELKDKIDMPIPDASATDTSPEGQEEAVSGEMADAVEALATLGYTRAEAVRAVRRAVEEGASGTESLLRTALKYIH